VSIHPQAAVSPYALVGANVKIGPFCVVEPGAVIGDNTTLASRVVVKSGTTIGKANHICEGAVLGGLPQHIHMPECPGRLTIGDGNVIRENVTIHRALEADKSTSIGSFGLFMVGAHVAHDCHLGDHVILTNNALLGGHVHVEDRAYLSGAVAVHQFCRIGRLAMVGGLARVRQDVPPFVTVDGGTTMVVGLNRVGLRRAGYTSAEMYQIKSAYKLIYRSGMPWDEMLESLEHEFSDGPAAEFAVFFRDGQRGFVQERRTPPGATVRLVRDEDDAQSHSLQGVEKMAG
jgi:UDP-N-acetylglucosamine acyltransferase